MKKLQKNFTSPEQSSRLLAMGVPADSANFKHDISEIECGNYDIPTFIYGKFSRYPEGCFLPCWSIFRLMEIYDLCNEDVETQHGWAAIGDFDYMEYVISRIEDGVLNFHNLD